MITDLFFNADFLLRVFQETNCYVFILTEDHKVYDTNISVSINLGLGHSYLRGKDFIDLIWDEEKTRTKTIIEESITDRRNIKKHFYLLDKEGNIKLIQFKGFLYEDEKSNNNYYVLIGEDITRLKLLEQSEQVEYDKFQTLFNSTGMGIVILNLDSSIIDVNRTFSDMVNMTGRELLKLKFDDIIYDTDEFNFIELKNALIDKKYMNIDVKIKKKHSFTIWSYMTVMVHKIEDETVFYIVTIQDVSDRKYLEMKLKEKEEKYHTLFMNSMNAVAFKKLIYDKNGKVTDYMLLDINLVYERVTGFNRNEVLGRPMKAKSQKHFHVSPETNMNRIEYYDKILRDGNNIHFVSEFSKTFHKKIDVYYYIIDKEDGILATVFGDYDVNEILSI